MTEWPADFPGMWRRTVQRHPDRVALRVAATGAAIGYAELDRQAAAMASTLADAGVGPGRLVGLRTADRLTFCRGLLGAWLAGAVPVPMASAAPDSYVDGLADRLGVATVLETAGVRLRAVPADGPLVPAGLAYVMHTSGSSGMPKPVALSHRALAGYCDAFVAATALSGADSVAQLAPTTFDVVFEELLPIWCVGGTAVLMADEPSDPAALLDTVEYNGITVVELTTVYWSLLVRHLLATGRQVPPGLRLLLMGGEIAPIGLIDASVAAGLPLIHVYGVTEAGITSTVHTFEPGRPVTAAVVGTPLANTTVYVVDGDLRPVPPGETGEVVIGGTGLAEGYLGDTAGTALRFVSVASGPLPTGRYYRTGDTGRLNEWGELQILGRLDAQVKISGVRVDPGEVEATLAASPDVADAAVVAVPGPDGRLRLLGYAVPADPASASGSALRRFLGDRLPPRLVPDRVVLLDSLPVTAHGKVDRQRLRELPLPHGDLPEIEGTQEQRRVADAWTRAIGRPPAGLDQSFADAGGDSLALLTVVSILREQGFDVTVEDCLAQPTVRALTAFLHPASGERADGPSMEDQQRELLRRRHLHRRRAAHRCTP